MHPFVTWNEHAARLCIDCLVLHIDIADVTKFWYRRAMASKNTSIALGEPFIEFARRKVASGEFGSTSEVVREAMRQYIAEDTKMAALERALKEGLESGPAEPFDFDAFLAEKRVNYKGAA